MATFSFSLSLFYCYIEQIFRFNALVYDNAFAKVAILKRVAHFEPAEEIVVPETDNEEFITNALRDLDLLQQQQASW